MPIDRNSGPYILVTPPSAGGPICFPEEGFRNSCERQAGVIIRPHMTLGEVVRILDGLQVRLGGLPLKRTKARRRVLESVIRGLEERLRYATNMPASDVIKYVRESQGEEYAARNR